MLKLTVTAVPGLAIEGSGSVNLTSSEKEMMERTEIKVYGDYSGGTPPTDFDSAVALYRSLPGMSGNAANNYAGTSILDVHFTPITDVCDDATFLLNAINDGLINAITQMLNELEATAVKANGLSLRGPPQSFPPLKDNLNLITRELTKDVGNIKSSLQKIIPDIRGGNGTGEEDLALLLQEYEASVFAFETINQFLIKRNREISAVFYLTESFPQDNDGNKNIQIMDFDSANDVDVFLKRDSVILLELDILTPMTLTQHFLNGNPDSEENFWFNDVEMNGHIGSLLRNLSNFAWENDQSETNGYLVTLQEIKDGNPNIKVEGYSGGNLRDAEFVVPSAPEQATVSEISHNSVNLSIKVFNQFTTGARVIVTDAFDVTKVIEKIFNFPEDLLSGDEMPITFTGLEAITLYTVSVKYLTNYGLSPPSPASRKFITAPSSPPTNLAVTETTTSSVTVTWAAPEVMGTVNGTTIPAEDLSYSIIIDG